MFRIICQKRRTAVGKIEAICISEKKGTVKRPVEEALLVEEFGIRGDAHAGKWHRQVSILGYEKIKEFNEQGGKVEDGDFGENLIVSGIDVDGLAVGFDRDRGRCMESGDHRRGDHRRSFNWRDFKGIIREDDGCDCEKYSSRGYRRTEGAYPGEMLSI